MAVFDETILTIVMDIEREDASRAVRKLSACNCASAMLYYSFYSDREHGYRRSRSRTPPRRQRRSPSPRRNRSPSPDYRVRLVYFRSSHLTFVLQSQHHRRRRYSRSPVRAQKEGAESEAPTMHTENFNDHDEAMNVSATVFVSPPTTLTFLQAIPSQPVNTNNEQNFNTEMPEEGNES